ncbi:MAG TPA: hypothetical protein VD963_08085 [Phycisphaerales bacterium]|nr:hypothetical protein [Phycisphaerales bacterium]
MHDQGSVRGSARVGSPETGGFGRGNDDFVRDSGDNARAGGEQNRAMAATGGAIREKAVQVKEEAKHAAREVAQDARQEGTALLGEIRDQFRGALTGTQVKTASCFTALSGALHNAASELEGQEASAAARYAHGAANSLDRARQYIESSPPERILSDIETLARRRPEIFLGAMAVGGLLLGRFLKASAQRRYQKDMEQMDQMGGDDPDDSAGFSERFAGDEEDGFARPRDSGARSGAGGSLGVGVGPGGEISGTEPMGTRGSFARDNDEDDAAGPTGGLRGGMD